jgi:PAS domain S-box-containing protein
LPDLTSLAAVHFSSSRNSPSRQGDAVITTDAHGLVTSLNALAESMTGWTQAEAVGLPLDGVFQIVHPETRQSMESPTVQAMRDGVNVGLSNRTLLIARNGYECPIGPVDDSAIPIRNPRGELTGVVLVFRDNTDLDRNDREVRLARAFADAIISTLREAFLVLDRHAVVKSANRAFYALFRSTPAATVGRRIAELGSGHWDIAPIRALLDAVVSGREPVRDFEVTIDVPELGSRSLLLNARRFGMVEDRPDLILLAIEDATDRKRVQDALRSSEERQRFVLDSIPQKIATTTPDGSVDYFNPQWSEFTGLPYATIRDWGWQQFIHPDDLSEHTGAWTRSIATGEPFEFESRFRRADGAYRWHVSRARPIRDESGRITMWVGTNPDIHDIKLAEFALQISEVRYRRLFETAKDGILILDLTSGRITDSNPFMAELLGYSHAQFSGRELWEIGLFEDRAENESAVRMLQETGYIRYEHLPLETAHGLRVEVEVVANAYREGDQRVIQCNIRDITERSRLEKKMLEQAKTLAELHRRKDEFLAMLSHELRNPLAPITNAVHLLRLQKSDDPVQLKARAIIERQVGQLTRIIDDLLEVSRISTGRIHLQQVRLGLNGIVERPVETTRPLIDLHKHSLTVDLSPEPVWLFADPARMEQVIVNLLTNSVKYTPDGGSIALTVRLRGDVAELTVADNGVGIDPDLLPQIFDLFTQAERSLDRSQGGLGIGLSLVRRLVEMHGGTVTATSVLAKGSEFVVRLPSFAATGQPADPEGDSSEPASGSLRILVVDDNLDATQSLSLLLESSGHRVRTASDGNGAIRVALEFRPQVVLLDIGLPGIDGFEVARQLRHSPLHRNIVLVAVTGYGQSTDKQRSKDAGFDHHLVKPADFQKVGEILSAVAGRLARPPATGGSSNDDESA